MKILGIESSCDDSSVSVVDSTQGVEFYWIYSHKEPKKFGGVVPEIASRTHHNAFKNFLELLLKEQFQLLKGVEAVAYTAGPGLLGSLWIGGSVAQALAWSYHLPLYPINHLHGHIFSPFIGKSLDCIQFPFLALLVSGGHSQIWQVESITQLKLLATTRNDAAGEALDKAARYAGLSYPGGPEISRCAKNFTHSQFRFPVSDFGPECFDFSFSGLKSSFFRKVDSIPKQQWPFLRDEVLAGFEIAVVENLLTQFEKAILKYKIPHLVISGGVSANLRLRTALKSLAQKYGCRLSLPELKYTGDNAAMIAYCALLQSQASIIGKDPISEPLQLFTRCQDCER